MQERPAASAPPSSHKTVTWLHSRDSMLYCHVAGAWLRWLERTVHIREVTGSSPVAPMKASCKQGAFHFCEILMPKPLVRRPTWCYAARCKWLQHSAQVGEPVITCDR